MDDVTRIDARGLLCPLPVLRLRKVLGALAPGTLVELIATDGASRIDVPHFCAQGGHELLAQSETRAGSGRVFHYRIRRGPDIGAGN